MAVRLVPAVRRSLDAADWIKGDKKFEALSAVALGYAETVDNAVSPEAHAKQLGWVGPHLVRTLEALKLVPTETSGKVANRLEEIRAAVHEEGSSDDGPRDPSDLDEAT